MIIITGGARINPGQMDTAIKLGCEHSARSRNEHGCIAHNCYIDAEDPARIVFVELWQDKAAVQAHFAVPASRTFVRELATLAQDEPEIHLFAAQELPQPIS